MRVLVIGGTRFVGPWVVRRLVEAGHEVAVFHRGRTEAELPEGVEEVRGDRARLASFAAALRRLRPRVVLDMVPYTERDARELLRTFRGVAERVVAAGSGDVYLAYDRLRRVSPGEPGPVPLAEDAPLREVLHPYRADAPGPEHWTYDYDKIPVERVVLGDPELPGTVLRLPCVYGPRDQFRRVREYLRRMDDGRPAILLEEGHAAWRWTRGYVEDVAAAVALAVTDARSAGRVYNVGEPDALTEAEWVRAIGRVAGWEGMVVAVPRGRLPAHLAPDDFDWRHHLATDSSRIRAELGWAEAVPRGEALRRTIAWERAHPPDGGAAQPDYAAEDAALRKIAGCLP
ncbi:MAG TPA: NAD-dependent epimerase/dehydratase family protein [Longimicrobium sp.]